MSYVCGKCGGRLLRDWGGFTHAHEPGVDQRTRRHQVRPVEQKADETVPPFEGS